MVGNDTCSEICRTILRLPVGAGREMEGFKFRKPVKGRIFCRLVNKLAILDPPIPELSNHH